MDDIDWTAAAKYLTGEASPAERAEFEAWMRGDPERERLVAELEPQLRRRERSVAVDVEAAWSRMAQRLDAEPLSVQNGARPPARSRRRETRVFFAASAAAAALVGVLLVPQWLASRNVSPGAEPQLASTASGERKSVVLGDGSRVTLAPMSSLRADVGPTGERRVELSGEALVVVFHDVSRPFVVRAGDAVITDLGTTFTVRARSNEPRVTVAVLEGSVALREKQRGTRVVVNAGGVGILERGAARTEAADVTEAAAWASGRLVFSRTPLTEVAAELERWHNVHVRVDPALAGRTLSATFSGETIDQIARAVAGALDVAVVRRGDTLTISPR